eukprot:gene26002-31834_t
MSTQREFTAAHLQTFALVPTEEKEAVKAADATSLHGVHVVMRLLISKGTTKVVERGAGERHSCVMRVQLVPGTPAGAARSRLLADQEAPLECSAVLSCVLQLPPYQRPDPPEASSAPSGRANSGLKLLFRHPLNWAPAASPLLALSVAAMCAPPNTGARVDTPGNVQFGTTRQQLDVMISVTNLFSSARKLTLLTE